jgi:proline utilization trans-activator
MRRPNFLTLETWSSTSSWRALSATFVSLLVLFKSSCGSVAHAWVVVTQIYGIPKATKGLYIHQVHSILNQLRAWQDELPPDIRVVERSTPRPVASLHLAYNQCIIQTTRPVLLHLFKLQFQLGPKSRDTTPRQGISSITLALAESCINAAQASSRLVESLFLDGSIATFGFWDAHHIFSAAMILIMSAIMKPSAMNSDLLETLLSVLRSLKSNGNIPAVDFCERLSQIQARVSNLRATGRLENSTAELQSRFRLSGETPKERSPANADREQPANTPISMQSGDLQGSNPSMLSHNDIDILGDPIIGSFLDGNQMQLLDAILPEGGIPNDFASDLDEHLLLGSW